MFIRTVAIMPNQMGSYLSALIIGKKINDKKVLGLIKTILDNHDFKVKGKGMPLGESNKSILC
jgi:hypothetical protein